MEIRFVKSVRPGLIALLCILSAACDSFGLGIPQTRDQDLAQYDQLEQMLQANRMAFATKDFSDARAFENTLFLYNYYGSYPGLHGYSKRTNTHVAYKFGVRLQQGYGYDASDELVVPVGLTVGELRAYAADQENTLKGMISLYSSLQYFFVSGGVVYVVTQDAMGTWLKKWTPGGPGVVPVRSLEDALGLSRVSRVGSFVIDGNVMMLFGGDDLDHLWRLDLDAQRATLMPALLANARDIDLRADGITYVASGGLYFIDTATKQQTKISDLIEDNPYRLNGTFADAHHFASSFARYGKYVIYRGMSGIFSYEIRANKIQPVLLDSRVAGPNNDGVTYLYPVVLKSGFLYVKGLQGAAGNTYEVDLNRVLR